MPLIILSGAIRFRAFRFFLLLRVSNRAVGVVVDGIKLGGSIPSHVKIRCVRVMWSEIVPWPFLIASRRSYAKGECLHEPS